MRILVCTKRDLYGCAIVNRLLPMLAEHQVVVILSDKTRPSEDEVPELAVLKLLEGELPLRILFPLIDGQRAPGRLLTFEGLEKRYDVPIRVVRSVKDGDELAMLMGFQPDLIVAARFSLIFKRPVLELPRFGIYNIHPGELPRYGGLFAPMRALVAGDPHLGCTVHRMDEGIDTGPIYGVARLVPRSDRSLLWHTGQLYLLGLTLFMELFGKLQLGEPIVLHPQDAAQRGYKSMPTAEDFAAFRGRGGWLVRPDDYLDAVSPFLAAGDSPPGWLPGGGLMVDAQVDAGAFAKSSNPP
jgi:hypothetical protein